MFALCRLASIEKPWRWNELVTLSAKYRDLAANAQLALTVSHPYYSEIVQEINVKIRV